jgi:hypothetical protein
VKRIVLFVVVLSLAVLGLAVQFIPNVSASSDQNEGNSFTIINRDAVTYGKTSGEWAGEWWQWALSVPTGGHPLFDRGDCSVGQSGPVWFLGGSFVSNTAVRNCTIPAGTFLFFPVLNGENSALEESQGDGCSAPPNPHATIVDVRGCVETYENGVLVSAEIDGAPVHNIAARYRMQSPAYSFTLPTDNVFKATTNSTHNYPAGTYFPSITDGYYLMLAPLAPGFHTIHFHGVAGSFVLDITYHLNVSH